MGPLLWIAAGALGLGWLLKPKAPTLPSGGVQIVQTPQGPVIVPTTVPPTAPQIIQTPQGPVVVPTTVPPQGGLPVSPVALPSKIHGMKQTTKPSVAEMDYTKILAEDLDQHLKTAGAGYSRPKLEAFQYFARLYVDGFYGPRAAGAVKYFTGHEPVQPVYGNASGSKKVAEYRPPGF